MTPKVSILTPIYNVEKLIERCAVSLFEQTYENIEYIFVNDCTKDNSIQVLESVLTRYPARQGCVRIINHEVNRGLAAARNTAVANCSGDFIMHVDSDDYLEPNAVELLLNRQLKTDADIVSGLAMMHTPDDDTLLPNPHYGTKEEMVLDMMQLTINHSIWRRIIRKSLYDEYGVTAQEGVNIGEDCWTMTQLAYYASSFSFIDEVVYHYDCIRDDSYTGNKGAIKKSLKEVIATAYLIIDFFKDKEQIYYDEANRVAIKYIALILKKAAQYGDSALYDEMLAKLRAFDKKYWSAIKWDKSYIRIVSQNYNCLRTALSLSKKYHKFLSH